MEAKKIRSIIDDYPACYNCYRTDRGLHVHHCLHGTANRKKADEDGLVVYLCSECHRKVHDKSSRLDRYLELTAQRAWMRVYGSEQDFIARYGKSFIGGTNDNQQ